MITYREPYREKLEIIMILVRFISMMRKKKKYLHAISSIIICFTRMQFDLLNVQLYYHNKNAACRKNLLYTSRKHRDSNSIAVYLIKLKKKTRIKRTINIISLLIFRKGNLNKDNFTCH